MKICEIKKLLSSETDISEELAMQLLADKELVFKRCMKISKKKGKRKERIRAGCKAVQNRDQPEIFRSKIAGIDEAGRGPLAGPVYAAAVILRLVNI